ncbi:MAG: SDR family oxidoreductase [Arachidicoccus sp.]|nr:SDR family oxidoreductase [Arachidicoccus sp.]
MNNKYALITGASGGIGKAIAYELAKRGRNLLLVARKENELSTIAKDISTKYSVDAEFIAIDLTSENAVQKIYDWTLQNNWQINMLVNNAGYGLWGNFEDLPFADQQNMLQLNVEIPVALAYKFIPHLRQQTPSYILNIASTAAYQAIPTLSLYAASKAFVLVFTRSLRLELKKKNIIVSCCSPGPVATGFIERAGMQAIAKAAEKFEMQPEEVAKIAIDGLLKGKAEIIPGFTNKFSAKSASILPKRFIEYISSSLYKK